MDRLIAEYAHRPGRINYVMHQFMPTEPSHA